MRRIITGALFAVSFLAASTFATPSDNSATTATAEAAAVQAYLALVQAVEKGDQAALVLLFLLWHSNNPCPSPGIHNAPGVPPSLIRTSPFINPRDF